jgi:uncharacterized NAD(P)/FAD-binding protein YdhS
LWRIRAEIRQARVQGIGWRAVIDGLRPVTAELWRGLDSVQKRRFLRHLRPFWDVHRHRMAPCTADHFARLRDAGVLRVSRGYLRDIQRLAGGAKVTMQHGETGALENFTVQRVIFATGLDASGPVQGLLAQLFANRIARAGPQGLGLDVTDALQVVAAGGTLAPRLWALGPIVRGVFWECLAVPDIRLQAQQLGEEITRQFLSEDRDMFIQGIE